MYGFNVKHGIFITRQKDFKSMSSLTTATFVSNRYRRITPDG